MEKTLYLQSPVTEDTIHQVMGLLMDTEDRRDLNIIIESDERAQVKGIEKALQDGNFAHRISQSNGKMTLEIKRNP